MPLCALAKFNRIKIKGSAYVALVHLNSRNANHLSVEDMLQITLTNESAEFLAYYPQYKSTYEETKEMYDTLIHVILETHRSGNTKGTTPNSGRVTTSHADSPMYFF